MFNEKNGHAESMTVIFSGKDECFFATVVP